MKKLLIIFVCGLMASCGAKKIVKDSLLVNPIPTGDVTQSNMNAIYQNDGTAVGAYVQLSAPIVFLKDAARKQTTEVVGGVLKHQTEVVGTRVEIPRVVPAISSQGKVIYQNGAPAVEPFLVEMVNIEQDEKGVNTIWLGVDSAQIKGNDSIASPTQLQFAFGVSRMLVKNIHRKTTSKKPATGSLNRLSNILASLNGDTPSAGDNGSGIESYSQSDFRYSPRLLTLYGYTKSSVEALVKKGDPNMSVKEIGRNNSTGKIAYRPFLQIDGATYYVAIDSAGEYWHVSENFINVFIDKYYDEATFINSQKDVYVQTKRVGQ